MSFEEDLRKESTFEEIEDNSVSNSSNSSLNSFASGNEFPNSTKNEASLNAVDESTKPIRQASDVVCELAWSIRDELILHLNRHSALLVGKRLSTGAKQTMMKSNMHLLNVLMNLPMKHGDQTERCRLVEDCSTDGLSMKSGSIDALDDSNEVILELDWAGKTKLINCLMENHHFAILYHSSVAEESKLDLVQKNKEVVNALMNLPFRIETNAALKTAEREKAIKLADQAFDKTNAQPMLHERGMNVDLGEKIFLIKFDEITEFLASDDAFAQMGRRSKLLCCNNVVCYLKIAKRPQEASPGSYLSVKLIAIVGSEISSIDAYFSIKLFDQSTSRYAAVERSATEMFTRSEFSNGWDRFMPISQLSESMYIKDNSIKLQLHLKVLNIEKTEY